MRQVTFANVWIVVTALLVTSAVGCASAVPQSRGPSTPGVPASPIETASAGPLVLGIDWGRAASVERPANYEESVPPSYSGNHPILRISGQAYIADVTALPGGGFIAVGYVPPDWTPVAWTAADASTWSIHPVGTTTFTFPVSVAVGANGLVVAVGRSGKLPAAWTSKDGVAWRQEDVAILGRDGVAERMTTIVAGSDGFVAGGSVGPELLDRQARFWWSADGVAWTPVVDERAAFHDAEVRSITRFKAGFVAVGVVGTAQHPTAAVAWTSPDGRRWTRVDDPAFDGGVAASVVAAPFGGLVAVGSDLDRREATAWVSPDGNRWTRAPSEGSRQHSGGYAWMTDVTAVGDELVAVGDYQGLQRGTAISWVSRDGLTWQQARSAPVQEGAEFYAITPGGPGAIAVGAFGAPDSYVPDVWLTPTGS
jgi:hypothetical protein